MSYYRPSFNQTVAMTRGRGGFSPRGGGSYRGSSRGGSGGGGPWGGRGGGYSPRGGERFHNNRPHPDEYRKSYNRDSYQGRERSPPRKRMRNNEAPSTRHDSYGGYGSSRYESYSERRSFSNDRHSGSISRRDEFRRPSGPPPQARGGYRGRLSSRGSRGIKLRDRPTRRRLLETSSYPVRKRIIRSTDYARRAKISKMRSAIARRTVKPKEENESPEKTAEESKDAEPKEEKPKEDTEKKEETSKDDTSVDKTPKKAFIKLVCPQCNIKTHTFRMYEIHLGSRKHLLTMRKLAVKQKSILAQMRQAQRATQNELEKSAEDLTDKTNFCPLCKLNYKQIKSVHQATEAHKNMKKFLMPYCKICSFSYKSPMAYESHCCSIEHIKRKQRYDNSNVDASAEEDNLENFTTIDSVGEDNEEKKEEPANLGIDQIRQLQAHYCDLCKMYLTRGDDSDMPGIIDRHCKQKVHRQRFARLKAAEKKNEGDADVKEKTDANESADDKIWEDVDKDLGDIIAEAESGNKSSDEEDSHVNGERFDKFNVTEKNGDEKIKEEKKEETAEVKSETVKAE